MPITGFRNYVVFLLYKLATSLLPYKLYIVFNFKFKFINYGYKLLTRHTY